MDKLNYFELGQLTYDPVNAPYEGHNLQACCLGGDMSFNSLW